MVDSDMLPRFKMLAVVSIAAALHLVACGKEDSGAAATAGKPAAKATSPAAKTPAKPATPSKLPDVMTPDEAMSHFKADKASMMGKRVKIKGYYNGHTTQGDQINVDVSPKPEAGSKGPLCIFPGSAKAALDKLKQTSQIVVSGKVDGAFFDRPKLTDCKLE